MATGRFRFDRFRLDAADRLLTLDGAPVDLNARYLDALALLVAESGRLVSKDRFLDEVWRGVPVTDEALTQCIRTLRRQLGDEAARPRFIETVPKHGYRFIAPVEADEASPPQAATATPDTWRRFYLTAAASAAGGGLAGAIGGLLYGVLIQSASPAMGGASVLLVLICLTVLVGLAGGAGVGLGIGAAAFLPGPSWRWTVLGGALGGLLTGAMVKLLGLDAFNLLFGQAPGEITGAGEGAVLGGAVGLAVWWAGRLPPRRGLAAAALLGTIAGALIPLLGGRLMGGSLDLLARQFPDSRLSLAGIGRLLGEPTFGLLSQVATATVEGLLFTTVTTGAVLYARSRFR